MDTKLKKYSRIGIIIMILAVFIPAIGTVAMYPVFNDRAKNFDYGTEVEQLSEDMLYELFTGSYVCYKEAREIQDGVNYSPSDLYLQYTKDDYKYNSNEEPYTLEELATSIDANVYIWQDNFEWVRASLDYTVYDKSGEMLISNTEDATLTFHDRDDKENNGHYATVIVMKFDSMGNLSAKQDYGNYSDTAANTLERYNRENILEDMVLPPSHSMYGSISVLQPSDITIVYAIPQNSELLINFDIWNEYLAYSRSGFSVWYEMILIVLAIIAFLLSFIRPLYRGNEKILKMPFEAALLILVGVWTIHYEMMNIVISTNSGTFLQPLKNLLYSQEVFSAVILVINGALWFFVFSLWYLAAASLHAVVAMRPKNYFKERSWIWKGYVNIKYKVKSFLAAMAEIDLTEQTTKHILKIVLINFVILVIFCSIWFRGIIAVAIYSIVLYVLLKKYVGKIQKQYKKLLEATNAMAEGNLDVVIEEDLGLFNSFKEKLQKIQNGFKKAVEKEVASQNMKTELITNVSHDLKTPLTAIITYVNLLQNENIKEDERKKYVEIIDNKSMRLKALIEDLFEVSMADSKNITIHRIHVDLIDLIKQVYYELSDKITEAELEFRLNLPDRKEILSLDSQKTYRIFENLFINCIKYALKGTRVYIDFEESDDEVVIMFKNISATELNFSPDRLTERFIRGDLARNTEGSGLGLAIARSFLELQGGRLDIVIDGDLFKVITRFNKKT